MKEKINQWNFVPSEDYTIAQLEANGKDADRERKDHQTERKEKNAKTKEMSSECLEQRLNRESK